MAGVVLAGRRNEGAFAATENVAWEAEIPIAGRPMVQHVLSALADAGLSILVLVGPQEAAPVGVRVVSPGPSLLENLRRGLEAAPEADAYLICTGDVPLITPEAVADFVSACREHGADLGYAVATRAICEARFPGTRRTYVKLREGELTGGNVFYLRQSAVPVALAFVERLFALRKQPLKMLPLLGAGIALRFLFRRLGVRDILQRVEQLTGLHPHAVITPHAEVAVDVDKPSDLDLARQELG